LRLIAGLCDGIFCPKRTPPAMRPRQLASLANALAASWLLVVSALPVIAYAPDFIGADTVLGSIMSLQNVTLYFWGQNRLLNVLPFAVSWITDPQSNLLALLYLASLASFSLLLLLALFARRAVAGRSDLVLPVFAALSATYLLVASPGRHLPHVHRALRICARPPPCRRRGLRDVVRHDQRAGPAGARRAPGPAGHRPEPRDRHSTRPGPRGGESLPSADIRP
jgi:hypothetical protein